MNLFSIPAHIPFLDAIATRWLNQKDPDQGLILVPTRRSARALGEAFLRATGGKPLLLPRITAIGAVDESPLLLGGALGAPPTVALVQRVAVLTRFTLAMRGANGAPRTADMAWPLAVELAALMDEAEWAEIDLRTALQRATEDTYAAHWARTLEFLQIVTDAWPDWLAAQGLSNPAKRQVDLLTAQAEAWSDHPPAFPVWGAGFAGSFPAVGRLLRVIARLPQGMVLFSALDMGMREQAWGQLDESHPQFGLKQLLAIIGATRSNVRVLRNPGPGGTSEERANTIAQALVPARAMAEWRSGSLAFADGLYRLDAADQQEEAMAIAMVLRGAIEQPGATAALVTPDRALATRVAAELKRFGIFADDSAGEELADTPPAVFLRLLAQALAEDLAPVPLLALLKHPLAAAGLAPAACRAAARKLELACLRGPRPKAGFAGLRRKLDRKGDAAPPAAKDLLSRIEHCLSPAWRVLSSVVAPPADCLTALVEAAERLATTDERPGSARLWAAEEGRALAGLIAEARAAWAVLPEQRKSVLPGLLDALLEGVVVRTRRGIRGREGAEHPRVFIWGLLEARLQTVDTVVLGGLAEGAWPPATDPGPWLSRPMRARVGLLSPEHRVGQAAHDFFTAACAARTVVLSSPRRRDGAPAVPARWLVRLDAFLAGSGASLPRHPATDWARMLDRPVNGAQPALPPAPRPPVALRPRRLSVTEIEKWLRDPYAIYARHVLKLARLDPLDQDSDAADYGAIVHEALHRFIGKHGLDWPREAPELLQQDMQHALDRAEIRPALAAWWRPRLLRIADWVANVEAKRRQAGAPLEVATEVAGEWE
ncbi:MAG: double-strand break repair protein AddB, partial [Acetobacteraceae bacterium]|nr:double-strand break repair protein AddB [Acetobacteraceae bacterium]